MKVFIAGARAITDLNDDIKARLLSIADKHCDVLIGDCSGADAAVQKFYFMLRYPNVTVYASNGIARNNLGNWRVNGIPVKDSVKGFDFYRQKDLAMANEADVGFMIWDRKSKGTLNNIIELVKQDKQVLIYLYGINKLVLIKDFDELCDFINKCDTSVQTIFRKNFSVSNMTGQQISFFE